MINPAKTDPATQTLSVRCLRCHGYQRYQRKNFANTVFDVLKQLLLIWMTPKWLASCVAASAMIKPVLPAFTSMSLQTGWISNCSKTSYWGEFWSTNIRNYSSENFDGIGSNHFENDKQFIISSGKCKWYFICRMWNWRHRLFLEPMSITKRSFQKFQQQRLFHCFHVKACSQAAIIVAKVKIYAWTFRAVKMVQEKFILQHNLRKRIYENYTDANVTVRISKLHLM